MSENQVGVLMGAGVLLISFLCAILVLFASMRSSQISREQEDDDEQNF